MSNKNVIGIVLLSILIIGLICLLGIIFGWIPTLVVLLGLSIFLGLLYLSFYLIESN